MHGSGPPTMPGRHGSGRSRGLRTIWTT